MVAGIILIYMRAFTVGDRVRISDTIGDVIEKTILVTRIITIKNEEITNEAGVEIMSPHYSALRDGNQTTVPEGHRPKSYVPPGFRFFNFGETVKKTDDKN